MAPQLLYPSSWPPADPALTGSNTLLCVFLCCPCRSYSWVGSMGLQPDPFVFFGMQPTTALNSSSGRRLLDAAAEQQEASAAGTGATCSAAATGSSEEQQGQQCVDSAHEGSEGQQRSQQRRSLLAAATLPVQGTVSVKEDPASYPSADVDAARGDGSVYLDDNGEITITGNIPDSVQVRSVPGGWRLRRVCVGRGGGFRAWCSQVFSVGWGVDAGAITCKFQVNTLT